MFYPFNNKNYFPEAKQGDNFTDLLTDAAIEYVTAEREKPFYLHMAYYAMHAPIGSKPELRKKFEKKRSKLPKLKKDRELDDYGHKPQKLRQDDPEYAGELANLDHNIGRLIDSLKSTGQYENTIIILTGDNGGRCSFSRRHPTSPRPLRAGKTFLFEGGLRVPLLIHWPGHAPQGIRSSALVTSMDFYPTLLEMAELPLNPEQHVDGVSLAPLLRGESNTLLRDTHYWHFPHYQKEGCYPASAIRVGNYKLIRNYHHNDTLLYDISSDPNEKTNLSSSMPGKVESLERQLSSYLNEVGAFIPKPKEGEQN